MRFCLDLLSKYLTVMHLRLAFTALHLGHVIRHFFGLIKVWIERSVGVGGKANEFGLQKELTHCLFPATGSPLCRTT